MEYYPRMVEKDIERWMKKRKVILLKGPRQSGKTTLFLHLRERFGGNYVSLDDESIMEAFEESPRMFAKRFGGGNLFIDEAQYSAKAGRIIKFIHDNFPDTRLFVTSSGSFDIRVMVSKYLVGRAVAFELFPLNFHEFVEWKAKDLSKIHEEWRNSILGFINGENVDIEKAFASEMNQLLEEFIIFGGFPEIVLERDEQYKKELLKNLQNMYLERDVFFFLGIRHLEKFRKMMRHLAASTGGMLSLSNISTGIGLDYRTAEKYLNILEATYIIRTVPPFHKSLSTEIRKFRKLYFVDTGLRNAIMGDFSPIGERPDRGKLMENFILNELRHMEVKYWRTKSKTEVDFVVKGKAGLVPIEVKGLSRHGRSFLSFLSTYRPKHAIVFSENKFGMEKIGNTDVLYVPHWMV